MRQPGDREQSECIAQAVGVVRLRAILGTLTCYYLAWMLIVSRRLLVQHGTVDPGLVDLLDRPPVAGDPNQAS